eukprot:1086516-Rhodomonas_salina.1
MPCVPRDRISVPHSAIPYTCVPPYWVWGTEIGDGGGQTSLRMTASSCCACSRDTLSFSVCVCSSTAAATSSTPSTSSTSSSTTST